MPLFVIVAEGPSGTHASTLILVDPTPRIKPDLMVALEFAGL